MYPSPRRMVYVGLKLFKWCQKYRNDTTNILLSNASLRDLRVTYIYRVTIQVGPNLPLTTRQKFRFGLTRPGWARLKRNFCLEVNGRFGPT